MKLKLQDRLIYINLRAKIKTQNKLLREFVESLSFEVFKKYWVGMFRMVQKEQILHLDRRLGLT